MESVPLKQQTQVQVRVNTFVRSVYNWMAIGLALTGFIAYFVANNETFLSLLFQVVGNQLRPTMLFYGLIIGELALVFILSLSCALLLRFWLPPIQLQLQRHLPVLPLFAITSTPSS